MELWMTPSLHAPSVAKSGLNRSEDRGLDFTLVTHRVLEDGPERTVSLSTWREQAVEEEIGGDAMSVYYVRPEDLDWGWGDGIPMAAREEIVIVPFPVEAPWKVDEKDTSPSSESGEGSAPHTSTPRGSGNTLVPPAGEFHPFQATRSKSGSIISSIHLTPQPLPLHPPSPPPPPADETLSDILATCEPPLTHLEPVLARVGILRTAHLHAVGRLSDAPRAEVRDAALKLGVTVLEWAMLLDRIRAL
ncbi:hypothetical protein FB45DRAFT_71805 [Roridomyces roridus]|uniref:Uncharacterized protein n=1 Tax=Roridomyces roridus TaxID=1738132 RepID=A0AAD7BMV5_9AGAR|nr:hypothetical protein FB45DRAFT_71805 [Roridomyces roridus]